jgi:hypothetical protein
VLLLANTPCAGMVCSRFESYLARIIEQDTRDWLMLYVSSWVVLSLMVRVKNVFMPFWQKGFVVFCENHFQKFKFTKNKKQKGQTIYENYCLFIIFILSFLKKLI